MPASRARVRLLICFLTATFGVVASLPAVWSPTQAEDSARAKLVQLTRDGHFKQRPMWSPVGAQLVYARHRGAAIFLYLAAADGTKERRLTDRNEPEFDAAWSPDGQHLAFAFDKTSPNQGDIEIYTITSEGKDPKAIATGEGKLSHEEWPAWSPDGNWIAYSSTHDDNQEIYLCRPDGSDKKRLTSDPALDAHPCWSPDSRRLAFATDRWGDLELAVLNVENSQIIRLTESTGLDDYPAWSPDGRTIAFTSNRDRNFEIYFIDADGDNPRNLTASRAWDSFPSWSPDGKLTFVSNQNGGFEIYCTAMPLVK